MVTTAIITGLGVLLGISLGISYLIYVRMRQLQREVEHMRSQMEVTTDELENIESSLKSMDI
ncbi:MAG: hypothetical protein ACOCT0_02915 [Halobacteriota archaeon]